MLEMFYYNVPKEQHPDVFKKIENQLFGVKALDFDYYAKILFRNSETRGGAEINIRWNNCPFYIR